MHEQVTIKVNAEVDRGVASLVAALNEIDGLITLDSCQNCYPWGANVFFTFGKDWKDLAELLQNLSTELSSPGLPVGFALWLQWLGSNDKPRAQVCVEPEHVVILADGIRRVSSSLNARTRQ